MSIASNRASNFEKTGIPIPASFVDQLDDQEVYEIVQKLRRKGNLPQLPPRKKTFYSMPLYRIEVQSDNTSITSTEVAVQQPQRRRRSSKQPMIAPAPQPRVTYIKPFGEEQADNEFEFHGQRQLNWRTAEAKKTSKPEVKQQVPYSGRSLSFEPMEETVEKQKTSFLCSANQVSWLKRETQIPQENTQGDLRQRLNRSIESLQKQAAAFIDRLAGVDGDEDDDQTYSTYYTADFTADFTAGETTVTNATREPVFGMNRVSAGRVGCVASIRDLLSKQDTIDEEATLASASLASTTETSITNSILNAETMDEESI